MVFVWQRDEVERLIGVLHRLDLVHRVLKMDIRICPSVKQQWKNLNLVDLGYKIRFREALWILIRRAHVPLGVEHVVVSPVSRPRAGLPAAQEIRCVCEGIQGQETAEDFPSEPIRSVSTQGSGPRYSMPARYRRELLVRGFW